MENRLRKLGPPSSCEVIIGDGTVTSQQIQAKSELTGDPLSLICHSQAKITLTNTAMISDHQSCLKTFYYGFHWLTFRCINGGVPL